MKNRKAFTLVELLAVIVILGLMMGIAIPNIMGIIKKQKQSTYLEDAKKMVSRAEYMIRSNTEVKKPSGSDCILMTLGYLDNGEFNSPPYGGAYFSNLSYVKVTNVKGKYEYRVQLFECTQLGASNTEKEGGIITAITRTCNNNTGTGINEIVSTSEDLNKPSIVTSKTFDSTGMPSCGSGNDYGKTSSNLDVIFDYN